MLFQWIERDLIRASPLVYFSLAPGKLLQDVGMPNTCVVFLEAVQIVGEENIKDFLLMDSAGGIRVEAIP